jgi:hypothetical protein
MRQNSKYVIRYYLNGKVKETINLNNPTTIIVARSKVKELKRLGKHKAGLLVPERV